jgi:asparagine synthase (glutamine-hydrolysing)
MTSTLMPYWLVSGDRSYMGIPIEIREPFLDYRIIEFAFRLPIRYLIRDGWQKWIVRKTIDPYLPSEIVWRKHKMGNPFPMKSFLMHNKEAVSRLCEQNKDLRQVHITHPNNAWKQLSFLLWKEWYINQNRSLFKTLKASRDPRNSWEHEPGYFSTFNDLEKAG